MAAARGLGSKAAGREAHKGAWVVGKALGTAGPVRVDQQVEEVVGRIVDRLADRVVVGREELVEWGLVGLRQPRKTDKRSFHPE